MQSNLYFNESIFFVLPSLRRFQGLQVTFRLSKVANEPYKVGNLKFKVAHLKHKVESAVRILHFTVRIV